MLCQNWGKDLQWGVGGGRRLLELSQGQRVKDIPLSFLITDYLCLPSSPVQSFVLFWSLQFISCLPEWIPAKNKEMNEWSYSLCAITLQIILPLRNHPFLYPTLNIAKFSAQHRCGRIRDQDLGDSKKFHYILGRFDQVHIGSEEHVPSVQHRRAKPMFKNRFNTLSKHFSTHAHLC